MIQSVRLESITLMAVSLKTFHLDIFSRKFIFADKDMSTVVVKLVRNINVVTLC